MIISLTTRVSLNCVPLQNNMIIVFRCCNLLHYSPGAWILHDIGHWIFEHPMFNALQTSQPLSTPVTDRRFYFQITTRCLGRLLCMRTYTRSNPKSSASSRHACDCDAINGFKHSEHCRMLADTTELARLNQNDKVFVGISAGVGVTSMDYRPSDETLQEQLADIRRNLHRLEQRLEVKSQREMAAHAVLMQWKSVALVLDRAFFVFYVLLIAVSLAVLFPRPSSETHSFWRKLQLWGGK